MTDPGPARAEPQRAAGERVMLEEWLDYHRATLRRKCAGLDDEQLRRRPASLRICPCSAWSGTSRTWNGWFLRGVAGQTAEQVPALYYSDEDPEGAFGNVAAADSAAVFATYDQAIADIRAATAGANFDRTFGDAGSPCSVRWVYLHMIEEYARHNGHADLLRERIDGSTGE